MSEFYSGMGLKARKYNYLFLVDAECNMSFFPSMVFLVLLLLDVHIFFFFYSLSTICMDLLVLQLKELLFLLFCLERYEMDFTFSLFTNFVCYLHLTP